MVHRALPGLALVFLTNLASLQPHWRTAARAIFFLFLGTLRLIPYSGPWLSLFPLQSGLLVSLRSDVSSLKRFLLTTLPETISSALRHL